MLTIELILPTKNLPIRRVLAKLFQSYIYHCLDNKEHDGYKHTNGKVFKSMNFKIFYIQNKIDIKFVALDPNNEKILANKILIEGIKLGEIHITQTTLSLIERKKSIKPTITLGGFISCAIKDGKLSKKKIYLEPKSDKFQEILRNNTLQKYEALFNKPYEKELTINFLNQKPKERLFYYSKGVIKAWYGVFEITADEEMLMMILQTGMGGDCMKGIGFVEIIK